MKSRELCDPSSGGKKPGKRISGFLVFALLILSFTMALAPLSFSRDARGTESPSYSLESGEIVNSASVSLAAPKGEDGIYDNTFQQNSNAVTAEVFTATWCSPCVDADVAFEELMEEEYSSSRLNVLFYHPYPDDEDPFGTPETQERIQTSYGYDSYPSAAFNGAVEELIGAPESVKLIYRTFTNELLDGEHTVSLRGQVEVNNRSVSLNLSATAVSDYKPLNLKLVVLLVEDHLYFENASNGITDNRNVVRDILTESVFTLEDKYYFDHSFSVDSQYNMSNSSVVILAQSAEYQFFGSLDDEEPEEKGDEDSNQLIYIGVVLALGLVLLFAFLAYNQQQNQILIDEMEKDSEGRKEVKDEQCPNCDSAFTSRDELKRHQKEKHYTKCPACGVSLKEENLEDHMHKVHGKS